MGYGVRTRRTMQAVCLLLMLCGCLLTGSVGAEPIPGYAITAADEVNLAPKAVWLPENAGTSLKAASLAASPSDFQWRPIGESALNLGVRTAPIWIALRLRTEADVRRYLTVGYPPLDHVQVHLFREGRSVASFRTGDQLPFSQRPVPYHKFAFPMELKDGNPYLLLVRVETTGALQVPLQLSSPESFIRMSQRSTALQMTFLGIMATLCIYNFLVWAAVRDSAYLWYVLYLSAYLLAHASFGGLGFQFLWPGLPAINAVSLPLFFSLSVAAASFFTHRFLNIRRHSRIWSLLILGVGWITAGLAALSLFLDYPLMIRLMIPAIGGGALLMFTGACYLWWRGEILARFYVIAWSILLLATVAFSASKYGALPMIPIIEFGPQIAGVVQMLLLSFALAWRINQERERRRQAQAEALAAQQHTNEQLEANVAERTEELRLAYDKLKVLSELDGLTQLKNRPYFDQALEREWRRNCRESQTVSLLMLDIDHFKSVNDRRGHPCGDAALRHVADICRQAVGRAADVVARFGGEEFVILLPATTLEAAAQLAERLRRDTERTAFFWDDERVPLTLSIGIAGCIPSRARSYEWLVRHADEALYNAKHQGRNRTRVSIEHEDGRTGICEAADLIRID